MNSVADLAREIIETTALLSKKGLVVASSGNVSARVNASSFLITPTGLSYEDLVPEDLVLVGLDGRAISGNREPSKELPLHRAVYLARPDALAVIHSHSPHATALAVCRLPLPVVVDELVFKTGGPVEVAQYAYPGSEELSRNVLAALGDRQSAFIANHGAICVGRSLQKALEVCEVVEEASRIYLLARGAGTAYELAPGVIQRQQATYREKIQKEAERDMGAPEQSGLRSPDGEAGGASC